VSVDVYDVRLADHALPLLGWLARTQAAPGWASSMPTSRHAAGESGEALADFGEIARGGARAARHRRALFFFLSAPPVGWTRCPPLATSSATALPPSVLTRHGVPDRDPR